MNEQKLMKIIEFFVPNYKWTIRKYDGALKLVNLWKFPYYTDAGVILMKVEKLLDFLLYIISLKNNKHILENIYEISINLSGSDKNTYIIVKKSEKWLTSIIYNKFYTHGIKWRD